MEPSSEFLAQIDDDTPDIKIPEPDEHSITEEEYKTSLDHLVECQKLVVYHKAVSHALFTFKA